MTSDKEAQEETRKLFLSYGGTLHALANWAVDEDDLETGLFFFPCTGRDEVFEENDDHTFFLAGVERDLGMEQAQRLRLLLVDALQFAEQEGRVAWNPNARFTMSVDVEGNCIREQEILNKLLAANGYRELPIDVTCPNMYPNVAERIHGAGINLDVVYAGNVW